MSTERHVKHIGIGGPSASEKLASVMFKLWQFVNGSTLLRFVSDGGTPAVHNGIAYGTPSNQTFFEAAGAYMVIEAVDAGTSWQLKLTTDNVGDLDGEYAPAGGWNAESFGSNPTSGDLEWNDSGAPDTSSSLYISESNKDGYTYFRCVLYDGGANEGFYVGGYHPVNPDSNTDPQVFLARTPKMDDNGVTLQWGYRLAGTSCRNRVPAEYPPFTTDLAAAGYAFIASDRVITDGFGSGGYGKDYDGIFINPLVWVHASSGHTLGYFGQYTMFGIDVTKADLDTDDDGNYLVFNDLSMRWVE